MPLYENGITKKMQICLIRLLMIKIYQDLLQKNGDDDYVGVHLSTACFFVQWHKKSLTFSL